MTVSRPSRACLGFCSLLMLFLSACDLPTSGPDFSFSPTVSAPLIFDKTFVFLGPSATGHESLIDTTDSAFDGLFNVSPADNTLQLVQNLDDFEIGDLNGVLPDLNLAPVDLAVSIGELAQQEFSATFETELGVFTLDPASAPLPPELFSEIPVLPDPSGGQTDILVPNFLVPPQVNLVSLNNLTLASVRFTQESAGANALSVELINDLGEPLTAASDPAQPPRITLLQNGQVLGSETFDFVGAGQRATVRISVAGQTFTTDDFTYRLDVGTASGVAPLLASPGSVRFKTEIEPLRYEETVVTNIPPQPDIDVSEPELSLAAGDLTFTGMVTQSGQATLHVTNTLPIPVRIEALDVKNLDAVAGYPAGSTVFSVAGPLIPAGGATDIPVDLGAVGVGARLSVTARASSEGTSQTVSLGASQGLQFSLVGDVTVDRLLFRPDAETFTAAGIIDLDIDDVRFTSDADYVTLKAGILEINDLINAMDLNLERVDISLPDFRVPPYRVQDSLVISFEGTADNPSAFKFRKIEGNDGPRSAALDLKDVRIYPRDNRLTYHINARSESSATVREVAATDEIRASIRVRDARLGTVSAYLEPFTVAVTTDAGDDGRLDVLDEREATITRLDELADLAEQDLDGLQFTGSAFTFDIRTNVTADLDLYAVLMGTTPAGETVYLSGRGDYAVSAGDTLASHFYAGGAPVPPQQMIRLKIEGAPAPGQTVTRSLVLDASNSNVDEFISALPEEVRYVGMALVQAGGGHAVLAEPFDLGASIGASIPLSFSSDFVFRDEIDANLTDLADLTDPTKDVVVEGATLLLSYENGIPLGLDARLEVLNELGEVAVTFPAEGKPALRLDGAPRDDAGTAVQAQAGLLEIPLDEGELRSLSRGQKVRLNLTFETGTEATPARLRADDSVRLSLRGDFSFEVHVGGN